MSFGDIVIVRYYEPIVLKTEPDMIDADRLNQLNEKFKTNVLVDKRQTQTFSCIALIKEINYYPFTKASTIITKIDKITKLINESNLISNEKDKLTEYQIKLGNLYAPPIETYTEYTFKIVQFQQNLIVQFSFSIGITENKHCH